METLEQRRLLAAGVPEWDYSAVDALSPGGEPIYIRLDGTNGPDHYSVDSTSGNIQFFNNDLAAPSIGTFSLGEIAGFIGIVNLLEQMNVGAGNNFFGGVWMNGNGGADQLDASGLVLHAAWLVGGDGNDILAGGSQDDKLEGGNDNDTISGGEGDDDLFGGDGDDILNGGIGGDVLYGGNGDDTLNGDAGNDDLYGEAGTDILTGGAGADDLDGGDNDDTLYTDGYGVTGGIQYDTTLSGGTGVDTLNANGAAVAGLVGYNNNDIETINGSGFDDQIDSSTYPLAGSPGWDAANGKTGVRVFGNGGNDTITGSPLVDLLNGGADNDTLSGLAGNDELIGEGGNDTLSGGSGADKLDGGLGDDSLDGGAGDGLVGDQLIGGDGTDTATYATSPSGVEVDLMTDDGFDDDNGGPDRAFATGGDALGDWFPNARGLNRDSNDVEFLIGSGFADMLGGTNKQANSIWGGDGNDLIAGRGGDDNLFGEAGNDSVWGGDGADLLEGGTGNDSLLGEAGVDYLFGGDGDDYLDGGQDADYLLADEGKDEVVVDFIGSGLAGSLEDAFFFGGFEEDTFTIRGIINPDPRSTYLNKIRAKQELTKRSLLGECDFGFGDVDRAKFT